MLIGVGNHIITMMRSCSMPGGCFFVFFCAQILFSIKIAHLAQNDYSAASSMICYITLALFLLSIQMYTSLVVKPSVVVCIYVILIPYEAIDLRRWFLIIYKRLYAKDDEQLHKMMLRSPFMASMMACNPRILAIGGCILVAACLYCLSNMAR